MGFLTEKTKKHGTYGNNESEKLNYRHSQTNKQQTNIESDKL